MSIKTLFQILRKDFKMALITILFVVVGYLFVSYKEIINATTKPCTEEVQELRRNILQIQESRLEETKERNRIVDSLKDHQRQRDRELDSLLNVIKYKASKIK